MTFGLYFVEQRRRPEVVPRNPMILIYKDSERDLRCFKPTDSHTVQATSELLNDEMCRIFHKLKSIACSSYHRHSFYWLLNCWECIRGWLSCLDLLVRPFEVSYMCQWINLILIVHGASCTKTASSCTNSPYQIYLRLCGGTCVSFELFSLLDER